MSKSVPRIDPATGEILGEAEAPAPARRRRTAAETVTAEATAAAPPIANVVEYTVSDISTAIRRTVEDTFGHVRVRGEVGRVSRPASGHVYLDLKDERAVLACVMWKSTAARQRFMPEQGMEVVATGRITTYAGQSKYQLVIDTIEPAGVGALMALLEERKRRLAAEGLFDESRKRALPWLPRVIGVVTSPSGAVIRDILHRLSDRFPRHVLVWPVRVQGETCAQEVARAIAGFNALPAAGGVVPRPDLVIVARGGGSLEDLWGFNEEIVVRAAAASRIPLISAVGHETDWTLLDLVADWRAPTPTAAAEKAVPVRAELLAWTAEMGARLRRAVRQGGEHRRQRLLAAARALPRPEDILGRARQRLDHAAGALTHALRHLVQQRRLALARTATRFSPALLAKRIATARERLAGYARRTRHALGRLLTTRRDTLHRVSTRLAASAPRGRLSVLRQRLNGDGRRLHDAASRLLDRHGRRLEALSRLLDTLSYRAVLERGFVLVQDATGARTLTRAAAVRPGQRLNLRFADGTRHAVAEGRPRRGRGGSPDRATPSPRRRGPARDSDDGGQGSLF